MTSLNDIQAAFIHDIYTGERTSVVYLDKNLTSTTLLDIYQNNTILGLTDILASAFPIVKKIVGEEFFKTIARYYIKSHPQPSGNRHTFGVDLEIFLDGFKLAASLPYLRDVAALEWAYFQATLADEASLLNFQSLTSEMSINPTFVLAIHPSVHIVLQKFNALDIWQEHQKKKIDAIELKSKTHQLIIWRGLNDSILMRPVSDILSTLIAHSQKGITFNEAMIAASNGVNNIKKFQQEFAEVLSLGVFSQKRKETL